MVDKITNSIINLENKTSKKSADFKNSVSKVDNYRSEDSTNIKINQKKVMNIYFIYFWYYLLVLFQWGIMLS